MGTYYIINNKKFAVEDDELQQVLMTAYSNKIRPLCPCTTPNPSMYIAQVGGKFIVKRMPSSGSNHSIDCNSYEIPEGLSGLGQISSNAIQEDTDTGIVALKLDFSLSKGASRKPPVPSDSEVGSVATDGHKMGLRATLHYLWEQAEFNKWSPRMQGKRTWYVIRKYLIEASNDKLAKGKTLADILYIPETFVLEHKEDIGNRRVKKLARLTDENSKTKQLMLLIGEVKQFKEARFDFKIIFKHLPDMHLFMNSDLNKRLVKRFANEIELWEANDNAHLIAIATFGMSNTGIASVEEIALMVVNENWIPYENVAEMKLVNLLTKKNVRFMKSLRYNLPSTKPMASALMTNEENETTALFIQPATATESYIEELLALTEDTKMNCHVWDAGSEDVPKLPL